MQLEGAIDVFVSHDWPRGITQYGDVQQLLRHKQYFQQEVRIWKLICDCLFMSWEQTLLHMDVWISQKIYHCLHSIIVNLKSVMYPPWIKPHSWTKKKKNPHYFLDMEVRPKLVSERKRCKKHTTHDVDGLTHLLFQPWQIQENRLGSNAGEELLHKLKPDYWFSAHLHTKFAALVNHPNSNKSTKFLALDKCLPHRRFLQVLGGYLCKLPFNRYCCTTYFSAFVLWWYFASGNVNYLYVCGSQWCIHPLIKGS